MEHIEYLLRFIDEDAPFGDITSEAIIPNVHCLALIRAEQSGVVAGLSEADEIFTYFGVEVTFGKRDGEEVLKGDTLISLSGSAKKILLAERTVLNIIGRMSGIATETSRMAAVVRGVNPRCRVAGTRKTCPGLRALDKKAIVLGGGDPHRFSLSDGILIKDNHLAIVPLVTAITAARGVSGYKKIEAEVETIPDAVAAVQAGADIILLDNMSPAQASDAINALKAVGLRDKVMIEISGGVQENTIGSYAKCGADVISIGSLTHTVKNFSVNLEIVPLKQSGG
jgi:nicotinate-nucleotide pyrophosphorylase (carboxylating)